MAGSLKPGSGSVRLCGDELETIGRKALARSIARRPPKLAQHPVRDDCRRGGRGWGRAAPTNRPLTGFGASWTSWPSPPRIDPRRGGSPARVATGQRAPLTRGAATGCSWAVAVAPGPHRSSSSTSRTAHLDIRHQGRRDGAARRPQRAVTARTIVGGPSHDLTLAAHFSSRRRGWSMDRPAGSSADGDPSTRARTGGHPEGIPGSIRPLVHLPVTVGWRGRRRRPGGPRSRRGVRDVGC